MTNEEKSKEIAEFHQCPYRVRSNGDSKIEYSITECYDSAMEMARWKDKQFNETLKRANESVTKAHEEGAKIERERIIEKACEWFRYVNEHNEDIVCVEDFIENFQKAMEESKTE